MKKILLTTTMVVLCVVATLKATVHVTNVNLLLNSNNLNANDGVYDSIDINQDGTFDFNLWCWNYYTTSPGYYSQAEISASNSLNYYDSHSFNSLNGSPSGTNSNSVIGWSNSPYLYFSSTQTGGAWHTTTPYLFIKFLSSTGNWHYGWLEVYTSSYTSSSTMLVSRMAWEDTPNTHITAGATTSGISNATALNTISVNMSNNKCFVSIEKNNANSQLEIYDINGALINSYNLTEEKNSITLNGMAKGLYVFTIRQNNEIVFRKKQLVSEGE